MYFSLENDLVNGRKKCLVYIKLSKADERKEDQASPIISTSMFKAPDTCYSDSLKNYSSLLSASCFCTCAAL